MNLIKEIGIPIQNGRIGKIAINVIASVYQLSEISWKAWICNKIAILKNHSPTPPLKIVYKFLVIIVLTFYRAWLLGSTNSTYVPLPLRSDLLLGGLKYYKNLMRIEWLLWPSSRPSYDLGDGVRTDMASVCSCQTLGPRGEHIKSYDDCGKDWGKLDIYQNSAKHSKTQ